ncbi:hypothetical protein ASPFODRAFT_376210 [Aspergillus luchuensis CBS 106.47]|uniref:Uncharacterized protein n=1 Tax=Aspergillus luchuensis (strain CBS 106.47) TaxID=1137211 RepID=A0A1M3T446_ASPLC|nr:hypothetical protein ASPFODRAFT_376210 [Aspergillus luchuensis CBS 106.47]
MHWKLEQLSRRRTGSEQVSLDRERLSAGLAYRASPHVWCFPRNKRKAPPCVVTDLFCCAKRCSPSLCLSLSSPLGFCTDS